MDNYFEQIKEILLQYTSNGKETLSTGATLIGKAPHVGPKAWLHYLFEPLSNEDIKTLETMLKTEIPNDYKFFLTKHSNGINIFSGALSLDGLRKSLGRTGVEVSAQCYSIITPNIDERPKNAKKEYFFIGGYSWDGSLLYINSTTGKVFFCKRNDATPLYEWETFHEMLVSEVKRIQTHFDAEGKRIDKKIPTVPILKE